MATVTIDGLVVKGPEGNIGDKDATDIIFAQFGLQLSEPPGRISADWTLRGSLGTIVSHPEARPIQGTPDGMVR